MILLDTNVLIYASDPRSAHHRWATTTIAEAVAGEGAAINAVCLAELCVGDVEPSAVAGRVRSWGVAILDVPSAAADICAKAYSLYLRRRGDSAAGSAPRMPLPDFFIGAHAQLMGWQMATADRGRFKTYFGKVELKLP